MARSAWTLLRWLAGRLLCATGNHDLEFVFNETGAQGDPRPRAGLWVCRRCGHHRWHWYLAALRREAGPWRWGPR